MKINFDCAVDGQAVLREVYAATRIPGNSDLAHEGSGC